MIVAFTATPVPINAYLNRKTSTWLIPIDEKKGHFLSTASMLWIIIAATLCLTLANCRLSRIEKELSIRDDLGQSVSEAKGYILWSGCMGMSLLPVWMDYSYQASWADLTTAKKLVLESDAEGKMKMNIGLYNPDEYDLIVMKKGYYPTLVPVNTKTGTIVLLSQKRYRTILQQYPTGAYKEDVTLVHGDKVLPGLIYMMLSYKYDLGYRLDEVPDKNKYNASNIYKSYKDHDGVYLQEKVTNAGK